MSTRHVLIRVPLLGRGCRKGVILPSSPRKRGPRNAVESWIPACVGMTEEVFCDSLRGEGADEGDTITESTIEEALNLIFADEKESYITKFKILTNNQIKCLRTLAKLGGKKVYSKDFVLAAGIPQSSIQSAIKVLVEYDILFESGNGLKFMNPFFRAWVLQQ